MFVGHYGVSFAIKGAHKRIPLWLLFVAVQLVDVLWAIFVMMGIEKVRITPGITATNPLDLYYMPYTHSLVAAFFWSAIAFVGYKLSRDNTRNAAFLVAGAVFSHWLLDLIVHRPDLPLYDNSFKMGFGVWNYPVLAFSLEAAVLLAGILIYVRSSRAISVAGKYGPPAFAIILLFLQAVVFFGAPPTSPLAAALTALFSYVLLAAIAYWLERKRT
jgi:hypothetical protein